jgi:GWxTD domain-containing protein
MRRLLVSLLFLASASVYAATANLPSLFYRAKEQFRLASYVQSLATLDAIEKESENPGNEAYRSQLAAPLAFYRGACHAALGHAEEAQKYFELYLTYQPNATLDPSLYPPRVIAALNEARKSAQQNDQKANRPAPDEPAETGSFAAAYRAFKYDGQTSDGADDNWADGPVRYLLTSQQRSDYARLSTLAERSEYVTEFWKAHDPHPETPENEFRMEFERRVAFADRRLGQQEARGSLTDRGMLFVLLGPPTWVGRKPLEVGDDTADPQGMSRYSSFEAGQALKGSSPSQAAAVLASMSGPANTIPQSEGNWKETWHYRRELLPSGVSYQQVDFLFLTRQGYGVDVLQRDAVALTTLDAAKSATRSGVTQKAAK